jgi:hypothetical protein
MAVFARQAQLDCVFIVASSALPQFSDAKKFNGARSQQQASSKWLEDREAHAAAWFRNTTYAL